MSSIDLHNHAILQKDVPHSFAIVFSPLHNTQPSYRITKFGMSSLQKCPKRNEQSFHEHSMTHKLYEEATHLNFNDSKLRVIDLRSNPMTPKLTRTRSQSKKRIFDRQ